MATPGTHPRRVSPCLICGGQCKRFPDSEHDARNPFLGVTAKDIEALDNPKPPPVKRPKGKRRPAEDRARRLQEDR